MRPHLASVGRGWTPLVAHASQSHRSAREGLLLRLWTVWNHPGADGNRSRGTLAYRNSPTANDKNGSVRCQERWGSHNGSPPPRQSRRRDQSTIRSSAVSAQTSPQPVPAGRVDKKLPWIVPYLLILHGVPH